MNHHVVRAHRDKVDADRVVEARLDGNLKLRSDAIVRRHEDWIAKAGCLQVEKRAKSAERCRCAWARGCLGKRLYPLDKRLARVDVHPCRCIGAF